MATYRLCWCSFWNCSYAWSSKQTNCCRWCYVLCAAWIQSFAERVRNNVWMYVCAVQMTHNFKNTYHRYILCSNGLKRTNKMRHEDEIIHRLHVTQYKRICQLVHILHILYDIDLLLCHFVRCCYCCCCCCFLSLSLTFVHLIFWSLRTIEQTRRYMYTIVVEKTGVHSAWHDTCLQFYMKNNGNESYL